MMSDEQNQKELHKYGLRMHTAITEAISPTLDEVGQKMGNYGIYAMAQKVACTFVEGAAMSLVSVKAGDPNKVGDDDILFCALVAACSNFKNADTKVLDRSTELFEKLRGYTYRGPWDTEH
jgi:hypothetical protein